MLTLVAGVVIAVKSSHLWRRWLSHTAYISSYEAKFQMFLIQLKIDQIIQFHWLVMYLRITLVDTE